MSISVFDIFKIGLGPSSSHTMGPMRAAQRFVTELDEAGLLERTANVTVELFGSLALTGKGHCTDKAVLVGLEGGLPDRVGADEVENALTRIRRDGRLRLLGRREIEFDEPMALLFHRNEVLPGHSNGMRFSALDAPGIVVCQRDYYSIGGGFVLDSGEIGQADEVRAAEVAELPYSFETGSELLELCESNGLAIHELVLENEQVWRQPDKVRAGLLNIWAVMRECAQRGFESEGTLPGVLQVKRRAPGLFRRLKSQLRASHTDPIDWVNAWALAVNEENAAGGRVVTAPTNGAAGIVPAVMHYYTRFVDGADDEGIVRFLLTAGAIGILYKKNASISGAEMGCQGEVGVACSMAAGGLISALGGSNEQIEVAAEIGMEHNLGLTCDPIAGLVQIPCIERNAMGAVKAINAARLAELGEGSQKVSLDQVIATMRQTGEDMSSSYKETSRGGLAVNVIEC